MARSAELYKDSPSLKRDKDSGKMGVSKPSQADAENMGLAGGPMPGTPGEMPVALHGAVVDMHDRHEVERKDMHKRHEDEVKDMHKRHLKEVSKLLKGDEKKESSGGDE